MESLHKAEPTPTEKKFTRKCVTVLQEKAARIYAENLESGKNITRKEIIKMAGGGIASQQKSGEFFAKKGFRIALADLLHERGIDKETIFDKLAEIIHDTTIDGRIKDKDAVLKAITERNKMVGDYAPMKSQNEDIIVQREFIIKPE